MSETSMLNLLKTFCTSWIQMLPFSFASNNLNESSREKVLWAKRAYLASSSRRFWVMWSLISLRNMKFSTLRYCSSSSSCSCAYNLLYSSASLYYSSYYRSCSALSYASSLLYSSASLCYSSYSCFCWRCSSESSTLWSSWIFYSSSSAYWLWVG